MTQIRIFQTLVIAATACYAAWFFLPSWPHYLTDLEHRVVGYSGYGAVLPVQHPIYSAGWFALWLIATVGLVLFQNWARHLYLVLALLGPVLAPFSGFIIQPPLDTLFSSANLLLDGAVLALAYLSPLADNFKKRNPGRLASPQSSL